MPVYLGEYDGCAKDRESKFERAINSFLANTYANKELIIIGDCCELSQKIVHQKFSEELKKELIIYKNLKRKKKLFSGKVRSKGLNLAKGEIIIYLDSDDMFSENHISQITQQMGELDWCYFNDYILNEQNKLVKKEVELELGSIGTSSIAHINHKKINWRWCNGYGHDYKFVKKLKRFSDNYDKIYGACYIICHIPNILDK